MLEPLTTEQVALAEQYRESFWWLYYKTVAKNSYLTKDEIHDCLMDGFMVTVRNFNPSRSSFVNLFCLNANNRLINQYNKKSKNKKRLSMESLQFSAGKEKFALINRIGAEDKYEFIEEENVEQLLSILDDEERSFIYMHFLLGKSQVEIGREHGLANRAVSKVLKTAKLKMKTFIEENNLYENYCW